MLKFGLKLWSSNDYYIRPALDLYEKKYFDYIELYAQPGTFSDFIGKWKKMELPFNIHAPHFGEGMNLAKKENEANNKILASEALRFADTLKAGQVVIHPGVAGDTAETIRQLKIIKDNRFVVENKPYFSVDGKYICNGYSPEEIKWIMEETGLGFCLDFGHAVCAANAKKLDPIEYINQFLALKPSLFHLTDGDYQSPYDSHLHYGGGNYPLKEFLGLIPKGSDMTNEAVKDSTENLDDFMKDMDYLKDL